jgi:hypothetical protein
MTNDTDAKCLISVSRRFGVHCRLHFPPVHRYRIMARADESIVDDAMLPEVSRIRA